MSIDHSLRLAAEDHRNEQARLVRALVRHEEQVRAMVDARWWRRVEPCFMTGSRPSDDFEGCTE